MDNIFSLPDFSTIFNSEFICICDFVTNLKLRFNDPKPNVDIHVIMSSVEKSGENGKSMFNKLFNYCKAQIVNWIVLVNFGRNLYVRS